MTPNPSNDYFPFVDQHLVESELSLFQQLVAVATTNAPYDFLTSASAFFASLYLLDHLYGDGEDNDSARVQLMTVFSQTAFRIIFQAFVLPAFLHQGLRYTSGNRLDQIETGTFKCSMAAFLKIGSLSAGAACAFFSLTPLFYEWAGTSPSLVNDSYQYIVFSLPVLFLQILNFGFQQTLVIMGKKNRMLIAALINGVFNSLPFLLSLVFRQPIPFVSPLRAIPSLFLVGNGVLFLYYGWYFSKKGVFPSLSTYQHPDYVAKISEIFGSFRKVGLGIFFQLLSELGILYIQPFLVSALFNHEEVSSVLTQLGAAGVLNLFSIIFAITFSIAASNAVSTQTQHLITCDQDQKAEFCHNIRSIIVTSTLTLFLCSVVLSGVLIFLAPYIMSLFYQKKDLELSGPSTNPYLFMSVIAVGTTCDYLRNLALFILRSFNINQYGTLVSYFCLWFVNLLLLYPVLAIGNMGVFGILVPYYASIFVGMLMLGNRLRLCMKEDGMMEALVSKAVENHAEILTDHERFLPRSLSRLFRSCSCASSDPESYQAFPPTP